ncbi:MerR family transcriptional regulator [Maritalea porphyrae]|jgi:DNA-binding transcriptional MerR regulator|uniref:MerR family transcriptional regulator n=1 Tax=Maritalea porphyrae TaxID=880732 RepID=UPI0022AFBBB8|nr:MerR family transcriptional regulator [Maritalea porphyrae]MCZ4273766.1 MerR family DNA-binding protein [Maritalea porphyrae]
MDRILEKPAEKKQDLFSIAELADEFSISTRTIRFYESKGLIIPDRVGTTRVFRRRDRTRLLLILRGKRLGFSLSEISDYLELYDADNTQATQTQHLLERVNSRLSMLRAQKEDLEIAVKELEAMQEYALQQLEKQTS